MYRAFTIILFVLGLAAGSAAIATVRKRWHAIKWLTVSACACFIEYIVVSAIFFAVDAFSILGVLLVQFIVNALLFAISSLLYRRKVGRSWPSIKWSLIGYHVPIGLAVIALLLGSGHYGFFGMGQDEGVYQTRAIDLMNGYTKRVYRLEEADFLETQAQKDSFLETTWNTLIGLYSADSHWTREEALKLPPFAKKGIDEDAEPNTAIYHAIPTYPALLALFGVLGGSYAHMMDAQTVFFVLCILVLWFISQNLGLKTGASTMVCLLFLLSPQILWLSRSALTEMTQALILCMFIYLITLRNNKGHRWWSAFTVTAFACLHITIYVLYPLFLAIYISLFLLEGDRRLILGAIWSSVSYIAGMVFMTIVSPFYVVMNLTPLARGPLTMGTAWYAVMAMGVAGLLVSVSLLILRPADGFKRLTASKGFDIFFKTGVVALVAWSALNAARGIGEGGLSQALTTNGLYVFMWLTGLIPIPLCLARLLKRGGKALGSANEAVVSGMFLYTVLLMACFFNPHIAYAYYYSRYLGPYIPVVCVMTGLAVREHSGRRVLAGMTAGALAMLPFDAVLVREKDDTYVSFDTLERMTEALGGEDNAVIFARDDAFLCRLLYLPVRATGARCALQQEDTKAQLSQLAEDHETVYFIGEDHTSTIPMERLFLRLQETAFLDDNMSNRLAYCPLPCGFNTFAEEISVYRYAQKRVYTADDLATTGRKEDGRIVLMLGEVQYGPYIHLPAGAYSVEVTGENLSHASLLSTANTGGTLIPTELVSSDDSRVVYSMTLAETMDQVEFLVINEQDEPVCVDRVIINDMTLKQ